MNKGYIKIALAFLSLAGYIQNIAFATEHAADVASETNPAPQKILSEEFGDLACEDINEIDVAIDHANESSILLLKLSETGTDDYSTYSKENESKNIYFKKIGNMDIGRFHLTIPSASKYSDVVENIWDFNHTKKYDYKFIKGNLARVYSKYLIIFEKLNIDPNYSPLIKKYVLAAKVIHSNDTTVIVCPSRPLNYLGKFDDEPNMKEILENTQPIQTDIDAEEALIKLGTNIAGFVIKKRDDNVQVTYINAIYDSGNSTEYADDKRDRNRAYVNILRLEPHLI
ncbi:fam-a protein [Plasmodium yoelii]|uniref:Fam-a protein n=2 Tax=Plasmodium yoelii TaxID=5861 RepID=A0AAF0B3B7_PLAYO|nr:fam-a protein [Plasmodium yoelii]WBY55874.1 fam-a protein [Plasmodium yoelii yoelii]CDU16869.1 fam-a protein [Plasmodium yoelii]VTZ75114.1 fam-a protein [Plasmodium yoelii]|eukprot:XP_730610.2 fam-a protein [Plasmodium yoelii]